MTTTSRDLRRAVLERYAEIARGERSGCGPSTTPTEAGCCGTSASTPSGSCCGPSSSTDAGGCSSSASAGLGYSAEDLGALPEGADLGLGCGNPGALAALREGEIVLDLGSGGGIDCFLAAQRVGDAGHVIGVDMTPEMIERARANAAKTGTRNVEFRLGEIENLPVADDSVDVVISNCVVNLSTDKARAYRETFRVLKPGGRLVISDIVAVGAIPPEVRADPDHYAGCVSGAVSPEQIEAMLEAAGFTGVEISTRTTAADAGSSFVRSASVQAVKPRS